MSSHEWSELYRMIVSAARRLPRPERRPVFCDVLIVGMYYWAAAHDRPQVWACRRANYHRPFLPRRLPSVSRFNRRIRSERCQAILRAVEARTRAASAEETQLLDSRPLPVGACSKDRQAKAGRVYGSFARGYRLHACTSLSGFYLAWKVTGMNVSEKPVARELIAQTRPRGLSLADGNYDCWYLYDDVAGHGGQLLATPRRGHGRGHRRPNPNRQIGNYLWQSHAAWHRATRNAVERTFGQHASYGGGLTHLPPWVRGLRRVEMWVRAKITLYHVRIRTRRATVCG